MGFIAHASPWSEKAKRYVKFKQRVRLTANLAGVPDEIPDGMEASIYITVFWEKAAHCDLDNLIKALTDSCFKRDRMVAQVSARRALNQEREAAIVYVTFRAKGEA